MRCRYLPPLFLVREVNLANQNPKVRFPWYLRLVFLIVGSCLLILLGTAATLEPSPAGYGTHQRLGLPPCSFMEWTGGKPCPSCGMTTSWAHMIRGQVFPSFSANSGGALLALTAMCAGPWLLFSGLFGRWVISPPNEAVVFIMGATILVVTLVDWAFRLTA